eukprot:TRINITY_DN24861_c0_g1_i1.p1 TRINITY_DN24861_c0_g1~~TRINITY_DN24861_c0_g1_i1.p1  ORF type:complete len:194 (+),score=31.83 TRINITY_DN24861_c0_g1_i1:70-582(+)
MTDDGPTIVGGSTYFLSGVMGGSGGGDNKEFGVAMESQDYRALLRDAVLAADPMARIVDPLALGEVRAAEWYPPGTPIENYWIDDAHVREMLAEVVAAAAASDVVISFLPSASMGSAVELHAARQASRIILVVAPGNMRGNWVVRSYADRIFESIEELRDWLLSKANSRL